MKYVILLIMVSLLLAACSPQLVDTSVQQEESMQDEMADDMNHIGCQEGEIDANGECLPATDKNVDLFGQDFSNEITTQEVDQGDLKGYLAKPMGEGSYPGVVMIHEWWGLNDNIKEMARILASEGYVVFAIDLYDGNVAEDSTAAREYATSVRSNPDAAVVKMQEAVTYLKEEQSATKVGSLGWCFGGQQSLAIALTGDTDATVIYYGSLTDNATQLANINGPVLGVFGSEDTGIPVESVKSFKAALEDLDIESDVYIYQGVGHAFANPSGSNYAPKETVDAWLKTTEFLENNLKE